jgi:cytochrome P450
MAAGDYPITETRARMREVDWSCYNTPPAASLDLFEAERPRCPVVHSAAHDGFFMLLDYQDVRTAMLDHATFSSEPQVLRPMLPRRPIPALEMDPPRHAAWRAIFNRAVTANAVSVEPLVRTDINRHIDGFIARGACDLVHDLAEPVPAEAICHLVGIDDALVPSVRVTALAMFAAQGDPSEFSRRQADFAEVTLPEVHARRAHPREDYLTQLASMQVEGKYLDDEDYVVLLAAFLGAGHHSTTSAMASLINEVFSRPALRDQLRRDPARIPAAIEETLRLRPPFYGFFRRAAAATQIGEVAIPAGSDVYMGWAAANRDPSMFPAPTAFRLDRGPNRHLSFGTGIHMCPGAPLARMELKVVLQELLDRIPDLQLEIAEPAYRFGGGDYAYIESLPAVFSPQPAP